MASKIELPKEPEGVSHKTVNRRSNVGYSGEVRAGLGSVDLDPLPAKPTKRDKKIDKSPSIP